MVKILLILIFCAKLFSDFSHIETLSSNFKQSVKTQNSEIKYSGNIHIKRPNSALWIYEKPIKKEIYIYDNRFIVYEIDLEQATISDIRESINIFEILSSSRLLKKSEDVEIFVGVFDDIEFTIEVKEKIPLSISYIDKLDNMVKIEFFDTSINREIKNELFIFKPSEFIDFIRL